MENCLRSPSTQVKMVICGWRPLGRETRDEDEAFEINHDLSTMGVIGFYSSLWTHSRTLNKKSRWVGREEEEDEIFSEQVEQLPFAELNSRSSKVKKRPTKSSNWLATEISAIFLDHRVGVWEEIDFIGWDFPYWGALISSSSSSFNVYCYLTDRRRRAKEQQITFVFLCRKTATNSITTTTTWSRNLHHGNTWITFE